MPVAKKMGFHSGFMSFVDWNISICKSFGFISVLLFFLRLKQLSEEPYTQEEAERAAGMGSYIPPKKIEVHTQALDEMDESS